MTLSKVYIELDKTNLEANIIDFSKFFKGKKQTKLPIDDLSDIDKTENLQNDDNSKNVEAGRKRLVDDDYDYDDGFIDDEELHYEELGPIAPSQWNFGFFVWKGPIENFIDTLPDDQLPEDGGYAIKKKKPNTSKDKSKRPESLSISPSKNSLPTLQGDSILTNSSSKKQFITTKQSSFISQTSSKGKDSTNDFEPNILLQKKRPVDDADDLSHKKSKQATPSLSNSRENVDLIPLDPIIEECMEELRSQARKESFIDKKSFPDSLRPILRSATRKATENECLDENFFYHIISILPYNKFTMKKLVGKMQINLRKDQLASYYESIKESIDAWVKEQNFHMLVGGNSKTEPESIDLTETIETAEEKKQKRIKWKPEVKTLFLSIMNCEIELIQLHNEWIAKSGKADPISETQTKKTVYQKISQMFPESTITSNDIQKLYFRLKLVKNSNSQSL